MPPPCRPGCRAARPGCPTTKTDPPPWHPAQAIIRLCAGLRTMLIGELPRMKISVRLLAVASLALASAGPFFVGAAEARPFAAKDLATLDRISDPQVSPNGHWAVYDLRVVDYAANKASHQLWVVDLKDNTPTPRML